MSTPVPLKSSAARPQSAFQSNARIPLEYCDGPTQRIYAVSAFFFLQALKLYYWLGIARSDYAAEFFGFILWLALDVAFLMALNYLRIPWLELPVIRMIIALFVLVVVNFVLFTASEVKGLMKTDGQLQNRKKMLLLGQFIQDQDMGLWHSGTKLSASN